MTSKKSKLRKNNNTRRNNYNSKPSIPTLFRATRILNADLT